MKTEEHLFFLKSEMRKGCSPSPLLNTVFEALAKAVKQNSKQKECE